MYNDNRQQGGNGFQGQENAFPQGRATMPPPAGYSPQKSSRSGRPDVPMGAPSNVPDLDGTMARPSDPFWMRRRYTREDSFPELRDVDLMKWDTPVPLPVPPVPQPKQRQPKAQEKLGPYPPKSQRSRTFQPPGNANPNPSNGNTRRANDQYMRSDRTDFNNDKKTKFDNSYANNSNNPNGSRRMKESGFATAGMGNGFGYRGNKQPTPPQATFKSRRVPVAPNQQQQGTRQPNVNNTAPDLGILMSRNFAESRRVHNGEAPGFNNRQPQSEKHSRNHRGGDGSRRVKKKVKKPIPPASYNAQKNWREPRPQTQLKGMPQKPMKTFQPPASFTPSFGPPPPKIRPQSQRPQERPPGPNFNTPGAHSQHRPQFQQVPQRGQPQQHGGFRGPAGPAAPPRVPSRNRNGDRVQNGNDFVSI